MNKYVRDKYWTELIQTGRVSGLSLSDFHATYRKNKLFRLRNFTYEYRYI